MIVSEAKNQKEEVKLEAALVEVEAVMTFKYINVIFGGSEGSVKNLRTIIPLSNLDQFTYKHFSQSFEMTSLMFPLLTLKNLQK